MSTTWYIKLHAFFGFNLIFILLNLSLLFYFILFVSIKDRLKTEEEEEKPIVLRLVRNFHLKLVLKSTLS